MITQASVSCLRGNSTREEWSFKLTPSTLIVPACAGIQSGHPLLLSAPVFLSYGDSVEDSRGRRVNWRAVRQCTEIVRSWCDLSNETWDLEHGYYARVRAVSRKASSKWVLTRRFDPKLDSKLKWQSVWKCDLRYTKRHPVEGWTRRRIFQKIHHLLG